METFDNVERFLSTTLAQQPSRRKWDELAASEDDEWWDALKCERETPG
jgi:hypothetical protein